MDIKAILQSLDVPDEVKAQAWDDYHNSTNQDDFKSRFNNLAIPDTIKATLWDSKWNTGPPRPEVGLHPPTQDKPMEDSTIGNIFGTAKQVGRQLVKFGAGVGEMLEPVTNPIGSIAKEQLNATTDQPILPKRLLQSVTEPVKQNLFMPTDQGVTERLANTVAGLLGANPQEAYQIHQETGNMGEAAAAYLTIPIAGTLLGVAQSRLSVPATATRSAVDSAASIIDKSAMRPTFNALKAKNIALVNLPSDIDVATGVTALTHPLKQQALKELGLDTDIFASRNILSSKSDIMGPVKRGGKYALDVLNKTVEIANRPIDAAMQAFGSQKVPQVQSAIVKELRAQAISYADIDPALSKAINGVADNVESGGSTVSGLNEIKVHANKELNNLFKASQGKQIAASAQSSYAYRLAADSIRENLYPAIKTMGGPDLVPYGVRESAAIIERDGVANTYFNRVAQEQAARSTMGYLDYVTQGSLYKSHVARRALEMEPLPMGKFNESFRKGLGTIGDLTPEKVSIQAANTTGTRKLLPSTTGNYTPYGQFQFTIAGDAPISALQSIKVFGSEDLKKVYLGSKEVPYAGHEPIKPTPPAEGTSRLRQKQQLGPVAETIPERVRGIQSGSKQRMEQSFGHAQNTYPERVSTGPATTTESNWQHIMPEPSEGNLAISGQGTLTTTDPTRVIRMISDISDELKRNPSMPPAMKSQLLSIQQNLQSQMQQFQAYANYQTPPRMTVHITPGSMGNRSLGKPVARSAAASTSMGVASRNNK